MAKCDITPISAFQSTNLNSKIDNFNRLSDRVLRSLGYPFVNVEIHRDTLYENISLACEMFAKFAGYTQEYLLFDSNIYDKNKGIRLDELFAIQNSESFAKQINAEATESKDFSTYIEEPETLYISTSAIPGTFFNQIPTLSASLGTPVRKTTLVGRTDGRYVVDDGEKGAKQGIVFIPLNQTLSVDDNVKTVTIKCNINKTINPGANRLDIFFTNQAYVDNTRLFAAVGTPAPPPGFYTLNELVQGENTITLTVPTQETAGTGYANNYMDHIGIVLRASQSGSFTEDIGEVEISNLRIISSSTPTGDTIRFAEKDLTLPSVIEPSLEDNIIINTPNGFNNENYGQPFSYGFKSISSTTDLFFEPASELSGGTFPNQIFTKDIHDTILTYNPTFSGLFTESSKQDFSIRGTETQNQREKFLNSFDYDVMDYRKVIAVQDFEEGSTTGINTLFTIEQTLAQQTYFSYAMGNYGFDLISWYILKDFLETREKLLATKRSYTFDDRTQTLRLYPQPDARGNGVRFYGVVSCYVERPIRDIIKEHWVYQYTLALTKIAVANIRGKYGNVQLFGGGSLNSTDLMSQGLAEKEKLETAMYEGAPGLGDAEPPMFFVG